MFPQDMRTEIDHDDLWRWMSKQIIANDGAFHADQEPRRVNGLRGIWATQDIPKDATLAAVRFELLNGLGNRTWSQIVLGSQNDQKCVVLNRFFLGMIVGCRSCRSQKSRFKTIHF